MSEEWKIEITVGDLDFDRAPEEAVARLDQRLKTLWSPSLSVALEFASAIYAPDGDTELARTEVEEQCSALFWQLLMRFYPRLPETFTARYRAIVTAVWRLLRIVRQTPREPFVEEQLAVTLRPVRRLGLSILTPEVCAALYDYHRGIWAPNLTRPQLHVIEQALAKTVAAFPPQAMVVFWDNLQSHDPMLRGAMLLGLKYLRSAHAVPHLLHGLEQIHDHTTRAAIVDCLEQIGEPEAIATLIRLRRETAGPDWTLSRQIARAIRVIEGQNRNQQHRTLLRPAYIADDPELCLLRPVGAPHDEDPIALLRSVVTHDESTRPGSAPARPDGQP